MEGGDHDGEVDRKDGDRHPLSRLVVPRSVHPESSLRGGRHRWKPRWPRSDGGFTEADVNARRKRHHGQVAETSRPNLVSSS